MNLIAKKEQNLVRVNGRRLDLTKMTYQLIVSSLVKNASIFPIRKDKDIIAIVVCVVSDQPIDITDLLKIDDFEYIADKIQLIHKTTLPLTTGGKVDEVSLKNEIEKDIIMKMEVSDIITVQNESCILFKEFSFETKPLHQWDIESNPFEGVSYKHTEDYQLSEEESKDIPLAYTVGPKFSLPDDAPKTLKDALVETAKKYPERGIQFILSDGKRDFISYKELLLRAKKALSVYRNHGIKAGETIIINTTDNRSYIEAYWGCILGGFLPTSVGTISEYTAENAVVQRLANVWKLLKNPIVVGNLGHVDRLNEIKEIWGEIPLKGIESESFIEALPDEDLFEALPDSPAIQLLTSGSTGVPKCILHKNKSLINRMWTSRYQDFGKDGEISLNFLPMDHVGGSLMFSARDIYFGYHQINAKVDQFLEKPTRLLDWINEFKVTMTWGANFVFALVNEYEEEIKEGNWDLSSLHHIINAAEAVTTNVCQKFLQMLAPFGLPISAMQPGFGMSETSSCILINQEMRTGDKTSGGAVVEKKSMNALLKLAAEEDIKGGIDEDKYAILPHCGKIAPGTEARITDKKNKILPEGMIGRLQIKGITLMEGYVDNPKANEEVFIGDGWMNTGDLGFILNKNVYITGREKDLIIINGANFLSFEIEAVIDETIGVKSTFSAAVGIFDPKEESEKLVVVYVPEGDEGIENEIKTVERIKQRVLRSFGLEVSYAIPVNQVDFPKTISGKIQRAKIKDSFYNKEYDEIIKTIDLIQKNERTIPQWFAKPQWQLKRIPDFKIKDKKGKRIVFSDSNQMIDDLIHENTIVVFDHNSENVSVKPEHSFIIDPLKEKAFKTVVESIEDEKIEEIVYLWTLNSSHTELQTLHYLYEVLQNLSSFSSQNCRLTIVVKDTGDNETYLGEKESLIGFVKTINNENNPYHAQLICFDAINKQVIQDLISEIKQPLIDEVISWRDNNRFVLKLEIINQGTIKEQFITERKKLYENQTWLITGGFGGIGSLLIPHLLSQYNINLHLISSSELTDERRSQFNSWKKLGNVSFSIVDILSKEAIRNFINEQESPINTLLHLAGASVKDNFENPENHLILNQSWEFAEKQLKVKIEGTNNLLEILNEQGIKSSFIQFSSVNGFFGGSGFGAYSAATSYQSGLVKQSKYSNVLVSTFNWSAWYQTGMNIDNKSHVLAEQRGFMTIKPNQGLISFDIALQLKEQQILIGLDLNNSYILREVLNVPTAIKPIVYTTSNEGLFQKINNYDQIEWLNQLNRIELAVLPLNSNETIDLKQLLYLDVKQKEKEVQEIIGEVQEKIAKIWSDILEVPIQNASANFFELGGHSIKAIQLITKINDVFQTDLNMSYLFDHPVLFEFAGVVENKIGNVSVDQIKNYGSKELYPLSYAQNRIWTVSVLERQNKLYNILGAWKLRGNIQVEKLKSVLEILVKRHQSLRLGFKEIEGQPYMFEKENPKITFNTIDFNAVNSNLKNKTLEDLIIQESKYEFDLEKGDLMRVKLIQIDKEEQVLLIGQHHIISDGWSLNQLIEEITILYEDIETKLEVNRIDFTDYVMWEKEQDTSLSKKYWLKKLSDYKDFLELPIDKKRPTIYNYEGDTKIMELPFSLQDKLRNLAKSKQTSLYNVMFMLYAGFIQKISGKNDLLIGTPVAGRNHNDLTSVIGMFVNTLPLRIQINENESFETLLSSTSQLIQQDLTHDNYPFEKLVSDLISERDLSRPPLIQTLFGYLSADLSMNLAGLEAEQLHVRHKISKFELSVQVLDQKEALAISFEYNTSLFKSETITHWQSLFLNFIEKIVSNPSLPLYKILLIDDNELQKVIHEFNDSQTNYPIESTVYEQFEIQVSKNPKAIAVKTENKEITYEELKDKVELWSGALQHLGVKKGDTLGISCKSSIELVIILLSTQQLGAIYVPLDYELPFARRKFIIEDSSLKFLLIQPEIFEAFEWPDANILILTEEPSEDIKAPLKRDCINVSSSDASYVCYTSGSTGLPKGAIIPQKGILRLVKNTNYYDITSSERFMTVVNFAFDSFTFEFWGGILNGATYYVVDKEKILDLKFLSQFIIENKITATFFTVTLFNQLIEQYPECISNMNCVLVGGEELSVIHMKKALKYLPIGLFNGYGPTENTTFSNIYPITCVTEDQLSIPIGKPISNSRMYILDNYLQPVPIGVIGDIYMAGDGLALSYLNRQELTSERFIENPFEKNSIMYLSGDLGRWTSDGLVEFFGRKDTQVKIRGYRIECGEIEQIISENTGGKDAVVIPQTDKNGHKRLVAYYTNSEKSADELTIALKDKLPSYMIPSAFMYLEELPKTSNLKIAINQLPEIKIGKVNEQIVLAQTELQMKLYDVWCDVLDGKEFGINDSFFDLGGDSILAVSLIGKLQRKNIPIDPKMIFMYPTIRELSEAIEAGKHLTKRTRTEKDYLIQLSSGIEEESRIYFLPPAGGTLMGYIELCRNINGFGDLFGLQGPGLFEDEEPQFLSYEQMLDIFELAIKDHFRPGKDYFAGHSLGGHFALGLTQRMERKGISVKGLLILDTVPDMEVESNEKVEMSQEELKMLTLVLGMGNMVGMQPDEFKEMSYEEAKQIILNKAREDEAVKKFMDNEYLEKYLKIQMNHILLSQMMKIDSTPIQAPITVFQTQLHVEDFMSRFEEWNHWAKTSFEIVPVEGNHVTMIRRPYVEGLGKQIESILSGVPSQFVNEI